MLIAQQIGRYHLLDRIAFGGMAEIYRARTFDSQGHEHMVAIKRVLRHLSDDDDFLQMLVDEAKIASILDHVNIARVYEFVRVEDDYFIVMEYVHGKDTRSILDRCRSDGISLPVEDCAYILMRTMEGLHSAHEKRDGAGAALHIVHRDVSPSNIIVSYQGHVKLCDFGIAKASLSRIQTRTGVIKGKVKYMSPEQAMGQPLDRRSDLFSGGTVLYELLTKQCPFQADNETELIFKVRDARHTRPSRVNPDVPPALERILRKAMSKSLGGRHQTAIELAEDLREFLRAVAPDYTPADLGRRLRQIFAEDLARNLQRLAEFELAEADPAAVGDNLLAETLGEGAPYTKFTAVPGFTEQQALIEDDKTRMMPRVPEPESRLPADVDLHAMKTEIFDPEERGARVLKRKKRPRPGANYSRDMSRETQQSTVLVDAPDAAPAVRDIHADDTQILDRGAVADVTDEEQRPDPDDTAPGSDEDPTPQE